MGGYKSRDRRRKWERRNFWRKSFPAWRGSVSRRQRHKKQGGWRDSSARCPQSYPFLACERIRTAAFDESDGRCGLWTSGCIKTHHALLLCVKWVKLILLNQIREEQRKVGCCICTHCLWRIYNGKAIICLWKIVTKLKEYFRLRLNISVKIILFIFKCKWFSFFNAIEEY